MGKGGKSKHQPPRLNVAQKNAFFDALIFSEQENNSTQIRTSKNIHQELNLL